MDIQIPNNGYIRVKIIPRSPKNEITEIIKDEEGEETIKIRIKAPPEKGKANAELIKFLSKTFNIKRDTISIISGKTDRLKLIKISSKDIPSDGSNKSPNN